MRKEDWAMNLRLDKLTLKFLNDKSEKGGLEKWNIGRGRYDGEMGSVRDGRRKAVR